MIFILKIPKTINYNIYTFKYISSLNTLLFLKSICWKCFFFLFASVLPMFPKFNNAYKALFSTHIVGTTKGLNVKGFRTQLLTL